MAAFMIFSFCAVIAMTAIGFRVKSEGRDEAFHA
jgi:hypothetical protein